MTKKSSVGSESDEQIVIKRGKIGIQTTADESKVVEENQDVLAALALAQVADEEKDISTCITTTNNNQTNLDTV